MGRASAYSSNMIKKYALELCICIRPFEVEQCSMKKEVGHLSVCAFISHA